MEYEKENKEAVAKINHYSAMGMVREYLLIKAPKLTAQQKIVVTISLLRQRQDTLERVSTADQKFDANAGGVTNCNDWFI